MKHRKNIAIAAGLLAVFCASFSIMWWQRNHIDAAPAIESAAVPPPQAAARPALPLAWAEPAAQPPAERASVMSRPAAITPAPASEEVDDDLPVIVGIVKKSDMFRDSSTNYEAVRKDVYEGVVSTASDKPLTITVIDTDVPTQESSQATFVLASRGERHFGMHDGLTMASGDQLTLRSPPYRDVVQQIP